ncbi:hypothetical protein [Actinophytocola sp.]|uniref:hypothetical protein n=1 Tax=Actinophytocola sp. TaxID=1872138 RepID=UPI003D6B3D96
MTSTRMKLLAAVGAVAITVTACAAEDGEATSPAAEREPVATPTEQSAAPTSSEEASTEAGEITPPGTELKVGETAVVRYRFAGSVENTVGMTVTAIEEGDQAAFTAKFGPKSKGYRPYYIRVTMENLSGTEMPGVSGPRLRALGPDGRTTGAVLVGDLDGCESESAPRDFTTAGATFETCVLQASREGEPVTGAEYDDDDAGYADDPISWTT